MHISKVELENIKSHASSVFEFGRGTTAIIGENGAGKTTIIEAIAWVLFDLLDYKKEVFLRQGAQKGWARVTFESGLDERQYAVYRDTSTAYNVTDPSLGTRIADKRDEVYRFLWQHMGLEPGTDLRTLFREAIGVPQGTFTAIFLQTALHRKTAFDRLLKVEEYRQAADKLRDAAKFVEANAAQVREDIARAEGELTRSQEVEDEYASQAKLAMELSTTLEATASELTTKKGVVAELDRKEQELNSLRQAMDKGRAEQEKADLLVRQAETALNRSSEASERIAIVRADHERHLQVLGRLKELERERTERDRLREQLVKVENAIVHVDAESKRIKEALESVAGANREIEALRPKIAEQDAVERELRRTNEQLASARSASDQLARVERRLAELRDAYKENHERLVAAKEKAALAAELTGLETRTGELMQSLANLQASLERDEKFQSEIKNGLCPILSQKCLNLKPGETLEMFVTSQFTDLRSQISNLRSEYDSINQRLLLAREASRAAAAIESLKHREAELKSDGTRLKEEREKGASEAALAGELESKVAAGESRLKLLEDPRGRVRQLEKELGRELVLREEQSKAEANLERLGSERKLLQEQLLEYKDTDRVLAELSATREATADAHRTFIANEAESNGLKTHQAEVEQAKDQARKLSGAAATAKGEYEKAAGSYDRAIYDAARAELVDLERRHAETSTRFETAKTREERLAGELLRFADLRKALTNEFREKERLEGVAEATAFIRDTLKEAAPRVARNYVYHVSQEANQMFREISGNAERTLKWAEDYSVILEEGGFERPFPSLSGGEQMAAALAVRLALLKQLTDIRIAFFDEPTTNMDAERRENFAIQISRITHFDQLFVISHDDTFDNYVDHVVHVGLEG